MNIEARKIEFIQEFLKLQSEEAISKLEEILRKEKKRLTTVKLNRFPLRN